MPVCRWMPRGVAALVSLATAHAALAAVEPASGIYNEYQYVVSASSNPAGLSGCATVGETFGGYFHFPGPAKAGAYTSGASESGSQMRMQICKYPTTPVAGATAYSGTLACTNTYQTGAPSSYSETFSWTITYVGNSSFLAQKTLTYPVTGGTCTEQRNVGFERTGK